MVDGILEPEETRRFATGPTISIYPGEGSIMSRNSCLSSEVESSGQEGDNGDGRVINVGASMPSRDKVAKSSQC